MVDTEVSHREINDALYQVGFKRDWSRPYSHIYIGALECAGRTIPASIQIDDINFVEFPKIRIEDETALPETVLPHVFGRNKDLCYYEHTLTVLDRYTPGPTVLRCLEKAKAVLREAISGKLSNDFAEEFFAYWGGTAYVDLPHDVNAKKVMLYVLRLSENDPDFPTGMFALEGKIPQALLQIHNQVTNSTPPLTRGCAVLPINKPLTVPPNATKWPPDTLKAMLEWLVRYAQLPFDIIQEAIRANPRGPWWVLLRASNGHFVFTFDLPREFWKPEFTQNRKDNLPTLVAKLSNRVKVTRLTGFPIDAGYVYGRNLHGKRGMQDKKVLLIGCGTIGGYLAHQLAQSGAGTGQGSLTLIDNQILLPANLGRHLLGLPFLHANKALACKQFIESHLPHISVSARASSALGILDALAHYDLIIDATGEEKFSIALNNSAVSVRPRSPPVLFVYLEGNGAAAQAIMTGEPASACYKCLKPDLNGPSRYRLLKSDTTSVRNLACGDATYIPFPVSRSVQAAALALEMCLGWANGKPGPLFRTRVFDEDLAFHVKDGSPGVSPKCPACGRP